MRSLTSLCIFLWKYTAYDIIDMVNVLHLSAKQAIPFTGKLSSFHFPPKNEELNKKWNRFVNRSDWVPTKHSVLCKLHFEDIYKIKLVEETSSYNPFRRTYRYAIRSSDHSNI